VAASEARQEVLFRIKAPAQFEKVRNALSGFRDQPLATHHFENAAKLFNLCRSRGVECGSTDILICAAAIEMQSAILTFDQGILTFDQGLLTFDRGLMRCIRVLRNEGLMS
jgi:predicted nucleic acid-binding protein